VHAEEAELAEVGGQLPRGHLAGLEPLGDVRAQPLLTEAAHRVAEFDVLGGQQRVDVEQVVDVHGLVDGRRHAPCLHRSAPSIGWRR
jgi:hypothetical protein